MNQLYKQRLSRHLIHMTKYLKYVFNDFFVIALIFLVGGLGLAYSNFLKTLHPGIWWISLIIGIVMLISVQLGRFASLNQDPDYVFLLPTDGLMKSYFKQALVYSDFNASIIQVIVWFVLLPLLQIQYQLNWRSLLGWLAILLLLKFNNLLSSLNSKFQGISWINSSQLNRIILPIIAIGLGMLIEPWLSVLISLLWSAILVIKFRKINGPVNWRKVIKSEDHRMHDIYTVFNMFVDVPNFGSAIVRRRYLSPLLNSIPLKRANTYLYLYWHGLVRDKEFSNLYLRLVLIGTVLLIFMKGTIFQIIMGLVFGYLIVFQIIPFYYHFDDNAFIHIYPLKGLNQLKSFQKMLWVLMGITEVLFIIGLFINHLSLISSASLLILMTIENYLMINWYLPRQIKKHY